MDCGRLFIDDPGLPLFAGFGDYIEIPQGRCEGDTDNLDSIDRYCGEVLACSPSTLANPTATPSSVCSSVRPFQLRFFTDSFEEISLEDGVPGVTDTTRMPQTGFNINFKQIPC